MPQISESSLERLNKGDSLVKILALTQVSWLIQLIVRKVVRLPSSQLEIAALAFSASSIITYCLYWNRPQSVETTWSIKALRLPKIEEITYLLRGGPSYLWAGKRGESSIDGDYDLVPIPNDSCENSLRLGVSSVRDGPVVSLIVGAIIGGTVFGGLHCLAWSFHFPTPAEAFLWKLCSIITTALPVLSMPMSFFWSDRNWRQTGRVKPRLIHLALLLGFVIPYVLARLFIMIETFRSLAFLPPEAFIDTWSSNFPHWS